MTEIQNRIDSYFEQLTEFINKLPLAEMNKDILKSISYSQFYKDCVIAEDYLPELNF